MSLKVIDEIIKEEMLNPELIEPIVLKLKDLGSYDLSFYDLPELDHSDIPELEWLPEKLSRFSESLEVTSDALLKLTDKVHKMEKDASQDKYVLKSKLMDIMKSGERIMKYAEASLKEGKADLRQITDKIPSSYNVRPNYYYSVTGEKIERIEEEISVRGYLTKNKYHISFARNSTSEKVVYFTNIKVAPLVGRGYKVEAKLEKGNLESYKAVPTWLS